MQSCVLPALRAATPAADPRCAPCGPYDQVPFSLVVVFTVLACILLYALYDRGVQTVPGHVALQLGISIGLFVGLMQQLSVLGLMSIVYEEPLQTMFRVVRIFAFDLEEVLLLGCIGSMSSAAQFVGKVGCIVVVVLFVALVHVCSVLLRHRGHFFERKPVLVAAAGTLAMICYITITLTILQPFQCTQNPNGMWTTRAYEDVICWSAEENSDHLVMLVVSLVALSMPLALFTKVILLVRRYPAAMRRGDTDFLRSYGFIFFRFRPSVHWYVLVVMSRSLLVGIVPVIPRATAQTYILQLALLLSFALCIHLKPWRVLSLNWVAVCFEAVTLVFLNIVAFMVDAGETNIEVVGWICVAMIICAVSSIPIVLIYAACKRFGKLRKRFAFFLCQCKTEAGAFARWLKMELLSCPSVSQEVFLDADNLDSLDDLLNVVAMDVQTLCVLGTKSVYLRAWCVGEITSATSNGVPGVLLSLPGHTKLSEGDIAQFYTLVPDIERLFSSGMGLELVKKALLALMAKEAIEIPHGISSSMMSLLASALAEGETTAEIEVAHRVQETSNTPIVVDATNFEANAAAHVLEK